jgi:UDPglucose 6-dehydrogenase
MKIGIIGLGVVGKAMLNGFKKVGFDVFEHDIVLGTKIEDLIDTEIVYVCVPTPANADNSCNTDIVESVVGELHDMSYNGVIAIKSTVTPGTTARLIKKHNNTKIMFVPEFLKERSAEYDFLHGHNVLIIGHSNIVESYIVERCHAAIAEKIIRTSPTEAELIKYKHNMFGALRVTFANTFFEICDQYDDVNYNTVKAGFVAKNKLPDEYLDVAPELRGYAGACFPKDAAAMDYLTQTELGLDLQLWENMIKENEKFTKTVFLGMRK